MTLGFRKRRKAPAACDHHFQMRIEIAGMSREVCETCGNVSVGYVESHISQTRAHELAAGLVAGWESKSDV